MRAFLIFDFIFSFCNLFSDLSLLLHCFARFLVEERFLGSAFFAFVVLVLVVVVFRTVFLLQGGLVETVPTCSNTA